MTQTILLVSTLAMLAGCSANNDTQNQQAAQTSQASATPAPQEAPATLKAADGRPFAIDHAAGFNAQDLPSNADLKTADGDLAKYGMAMCDQNITTAGKLMECDVYVQQDKGGSLIGYTMLGQGDKGVGFYTTADLNPDKGSGASTCAFGGMITDAKDLSKDFDGSMSYSAWEKEPGNWLISTDDAGDDQNFANGMWYLHKEGNKLRITQERWNPCYSSAKNGSIDDVFIRAVALTARPSQS